MDKSKKEIVFSIKEGLDSYNITDDSVFDEDYIGYQVDIARIAIIKEEMAAGKLSAQYYQKMCCIEVLCNKEGCDVPGIGMVYQTDCDRSWENLPAVVTDFADIVPNLASAKVETTSAGDMLVRTLSLIEQQGELSELYPSACHT